MQRWKTIGVVAEGDDIMVGGLNPWTLEWRSVEEEPLLLPHPSYPDQRHKMNIYEISSGGRRVRFAAGELSANVWGFYVAVPPLG
jgi:hypothetical protein